MPTLAILGRVRIRMFANDHLPPHFHIWTPEGEGVVDVAGLTLIRGRLRKQDLELALGWARKNSELLTATWTELND